MIRLLRHDESVLREEDCAVRFDDLAEKFKAKFDGTSQWTIEAWISFLAKGGGPKKRLQYCLNPRSSKLFLCFRAIQGHSGSTLVDPTLQDNVLLPDDFSESIYHVGNESGIHSITKSGLIPGGRSLKRDRQSEYIYHVGCAINLHSIINSGLIPGGQNLSNRQYLFFLPVDPMDKNHKDPDTIDLNAPRHAQYMHKAWKRHQNTVYWVDINLALKKGLKFYQTRSHAIVLFNTLLAICFEKVVYMKIGEDLYCKVHQSPRLPHVVLTYAKSAIWTSGSS